MKFRSGAGCTYCNLSGYRGRTSIYELIEVDASMADAIRTGDSAAFERAALAQPGYTSLTRSAIDLAAASGTTLTEAIATTSGLDFGTAAVRADALGDDELTDALLSGRAARG
jgi:MSHA biogenesis protein MshE